MSTPPNGLRDEHGIFGDSEPRVSVEVERAEADAPGQERLLDSREPQAPEPTQGVTNPSRRGSSSRFLTDVICDMGLVSREQIDRAVESSRIEGTTPERVLLAGKTLAPD